MIDSDNGKRQRQAATATATATANGNGDFQRLHITTQLATLLSNTQRTHIYIENELHKNNRVMTTHNDTIHQV